MADDGAAGPTGGSAGHGGAPAVDTATADFGTTKRTATATAQAFEEWPASPQLATPNPFSRKNTSVDLDDYFSGPRDILKHSKWPLFMQLHGSILPKMIVPLTMVALWSTLITCIQKLLGRHVGISSVLLTVTGFVVGLGLSFRTSTAYERYAEGRRYWGQMTLTAQSLGRVFWIHTNERPGQEKQDLLGKLTALNLIVAFAVALKHKLRFEPYANYDDLIDLVGHLDTFAGAATTADIYTAKPPGFFKSTGDRLGLSFAASNPRKAIKQAQAPIGNLPLEVLSYLAAYVDDIITAGQLPIGMTQTYAYNGLQALNDVLSNTERVLTTPLPIAYTISISQITWVYVILLPFQLLDTLDWITIPAAVAASYIILGILFIGREIENPFGNDVNDLPLEFFCDQIMQDLETLTARPKPSLKSYVNNAANKVLFPHSHASCELWERRPDGAIRAALGNRPYARYVQGQVREQEKATLRKTKSNPEAASAANSV